MMELQNPTRSRTFQRWRKQVDNDRKRKRSEKDDGKKDWKRNKFITVEEQFKAIGSSNMYNDTSTEANYEWGSVISPVVLSSRDEQRTLKSLKTLSAMKIAENQNLLSSSMLKSSSWQVWKLVWEYISLWRRDSFQTFELFASNFSKEAQFMCHPFVTNQVLAKKDMILKSSLPNETRHRVERVFGNIRFSNFVTTMNSLTFDNMVMLEINKPMKYDELIHLTNLTNLMALKIGRLTTIPDLVLDRWCTCIKAGKWKNLQVLSLPLESQGALCKLQKIAASCKLLYIEVTGKTIVNIQRDWKDLDLINWTVTNDRAMENLPWGIKAQTIMKKYKITNHTKLPSPSTILLDFHVVNHTYIGKFKDLESEYDQLWSLRGLTGFSQAIVLNDKAVPEITATAIRPGSVQHSGAGTKKPTIVKKLQVRNLKSFFNM
ncbi:uncharacterized protein CYBJADRAFT_187448 [Cyberlindnera jadinii NRRL Y-1542]|uniref:Uncharacterized protein n=1 Tax=Cyberlindnera jadinii (strain ATCC 18201 / CBS 1600 / BCRC 20928 / JCM 3617 / NBRC 0987 / NRRL Y-1542) TaxID=983966 RepID=A0A1E4RTJ1_CYBJN|nr:hypothetical protein CYBJADRAFT_187448 [Cyberlindnera jadinii NRRL Y-1542]ODV70580.1 hypothetical protein CYBJADRAFT_187448 [Cyberlindnera jadinii NRRL Y-1542]